MILAWRIDDVRCSRLEDQNRKTDRMKVDFDLVASVTWTVEERGSLCVCLVSSMDLILANGVWPKEHLHLDRIFIIITQRSG